MGLILPDDGSPPPPVSDPGSRLGRGERFPQALPPWPRSSPRFAFLAASNVAVED